MQQPHTLSDQELESRLKNLVHRERKLLHIILEHIKELDTRKLYLERAYSSLYDYLTKELGYSGSAAMRRIEAARLLWEVPEVADKIQEGTLNLSQIGELSRALKEKERTTGQIFTGSEKQVLLSKIAEKTTLETQKELAVTLDLPVKEFEKQKLQQDESVRMELTFSKEQFQKLMECRDLAAHLMKQNNSDSSWASVLEVLADSYLSKKQASKVEPATQNKISDQTMPDLTVPKKITTVSASHRHIKTLTVKTRKAILQRDLCCQYQDPQTKRCCGSTHALQIDHRTPQWAGGSHDPNNLQVLCGNHNRYKYQKEINLKMKGI